jgi:hypothetical protein
MILLCIEVSINKVDRNEDDVDGIDKYKLQFRFMDEIESVEVDSLKKLTLFEYCKDIR